MRSSSERPPPPPGFPSPPVASKTRSEDQDKTTLWHPDSEHRPSRPDEITARAIPRRNATAFAVQELPSQSTRLTSRRSRREGAAFGLGVLMGFLLAVALSLGILLFLVSTGRASIVL